MSCWPCVLLQKLGERRPAFGCSMDNGKGSSTAPWPKPSPKTAVLHSLVRMHCCRAPPHALFWLAWLKGQCLWGSESKNHRKLAKLGLAST